MIENKMLNNLKSIKKDKIFDDSIKENKILEITLSFYPTATKEADTLRINSLGLINKSLRNKKDRYTYFGYFSDLNNTNISEENTIDYLLPKKNINKENEVLNKDDKNEGRYFQIYYNNDNYYIKDLGKGLGTFVKIKGCLQLKDSTLINIGDSFIIVNFIYDNQMHSVDVSVSNSISQNADKVIGTNAKMRLRIYEGKYANSFKELIFMPNENKVIKIGRTKHNNDVEIDDHLISKMNSHIIYRNNEGWIIKDGNEYTDKDGKLVKTNSTNGTWFLPIDDYLIYDGMIFKGNFILFKCQIVNNN